MCNYYIQSVHDTRVHTSVHTHVYTSVHTREVTNVYTSVHICIHTSTDSSIRYRYTYIRVYVQVYVRVHHTKSYLLCDFWSTWNLENGVITAPCSYFRDRWKWTNVDWNQVKWYEDKMRRFVSKWFEAIYNDSIDWLFDWIEWFNDCCCLCFVLCCWWKLSDWLWQLKRAACNCTRTISNCQNQSNFESWIIPSFLCD